MDRFLKDLFLRNWQWKLVSLLLAIVLWLSLYPEEKMFSVKTLTVPLHLHNIPANMEVVQKPPATVDVKVRASRRLLGQITAANVSAGLDLSDATVDQVNFPLGPEMISVLEGAEVQQVTPTQVQLRLEALIEKELDVEVDFIGSLPDGYELQYEILPPTVRVRGAQNKFKDNFKLKTIPIDQSQLTVSQDREVALILPDQDLSWASSLRTVTIRMLLQKKEETEAEEKKPPVKKKAPARY